MTVNRKLPSRKNKRTFKRNGMSRKTQKVMNGGGSNTHQRKPVARTSSIRRTGSIRSVHGNPNESESKGGRFKSLVTTKVIPFIRKKQPNIGSMSASSDYEDPSQFIASLPKLKEEVLNTRSSHTTSTQSSTKPEEPIYMIMTTPPSVKGGPHKFENSIKSRGSRKLHGELLNRISTLLPKRAKSLPTTISRALSRALSLTRKQALPLEQQIALEEQAKAARRRSMPLPAIPYPGEEPIYVSMATPEVPGPRVNRATKGLLSSGRKPNSTTSSNKSFETNF